MDECDVVVPRSEIANYIKFTYELAKTYQIRIPSLVMQEMEIYTSIFVKIIIQMRYLLKN